MGFQPLKIGYYLLDDFNQSRTSIQFLVTHIDGTDLSRDNDIPKIQAIVNSIGNWELAVSSLKCLLFELGMIPDDEPILDTFEVGNGPAIYDIIFSADILEGISYGVRMNLTIDERRRRASLGLPENLQIKEIYDQLKNVPKWKALQKTSKFIQQ